MTYEISFHRPGLTRRGWAFISLALSWAVILSSAPSRAVSDPVHVSADIKSPLVDFAVQELRAASAQCREVPDVFLEVQDGQPESFTIRKAGRKVTVQGGDLKGLMYGTLELAEQLRLNGTVRAIRDETQKPFLRIRALKFNIPLAGTMYLSEEDLKHNQWFWDLNYWQSFLDMAARNRYNSISFWSAHPYDRLVRISKYPEATSLPPEELDRNIRFFRSLFRMARERGIDPYLITWNIHNSPSFAKAHNLPASNVDNELVRDYQRECLKSLLATYPDLIGLGTTPGEAMDVIPEPQRAAWISDVYFRAIRESGRKEVPFVLRYWGGTPASTQEVASLYDRGPIYLDIKYNGEHMYSSTRDHVEDPAWVNRTRSYKLLWHLRNDDIYILRWGNPQWVSELIRNMARTDTVGFTEGSEIDVPGVDRIHTPEARQHQKHQYKFDRMWFRFALWGRLGYNPDLPEDHWETRFRHDFGPAGGSMYRATVAASRIAPTITSYHWNYMNGDWYPEGSIGSWNTAFEQARINYRLNEMYHSLPTYIFNNTIDSTLEDVPAYVARTLADDSPTAGTQSPLEVADDLEADGRAALAISATPDPGGDYSKEFVCARLDNESYGHLGLYYAEKIRGAVALATFMFSGDVSHKTRAVTHLRAALDHWKSLVRITKSHYIPHEVWLFGQFHWEMYTPWVEQDIALAEAAEPFARSRQPWQVRSGEGSWQDFESVVFSPFGRAGLHEWVLHFNTVYNSGRLRKLFPNTRNVSWKASIRPPQGERAIVEIAGDDSARVTKDGQAVSVTTLEATRSYALYDLGEGGEVQVESAAGIPFLSQIASEPKPIFEGAASSVSPPLARTSAGTLTIPENSGPTEDGTWVASTLLEKGTAIYSFDVARPGFYAVWCQVRNTGAKNASFSYTLDGWNGRSHGIQAPAGGDWKWVRSPRAIGIGAGPHKLRLKFYRPGIELRQVRIVSIAPGEEASPE